MFAYIMRRLGMIGVILFGSSFILYNMAAIAGDPIGELRLSNDPTAKQAIIDLTNRLQLDVPPLFVISSGLRASLESSLESLTSAIS